MEAGPGKGIFAKWLRVGEQRYLLAAVVLFACAVLCLWREDLKTAIGALEQVLPLPEAACCLLAALCVLLPRSR